MGVGIGESGRQQRHTTLCGTDVLGTDLAGIFMSGINREATNI